VARDRNAGRKSQFISFQARRTPRADRRSRCRPSSSTPPPAHRPLPAPPLALSGPLMTLENRSSRSPAHCHSSLSHAPLIARYLSRRRLFTRRPGVLDGRRLCAGPISFVATARNRNLPARVINYVARRVRIPSTIGGSPTTAITADALSEQSESKSRRAARDDNPSLSPPPAAPAGPPPPSQARLRPLLPMISCREGG